jgi:DNA gyrase subunit A
MVPVDDLDADKVLVFLSRGGLMKRTELSEFSNPRAGGVIAAGVKKGDRILSVELSDRTAEIVLLTSGGRAIRFSEEDVSVMGRTARGVKGIDVKGGDHVVGMVMVRRDASVLTITDRGMGKRTPVSEFPLQKRGGMGTLALPSSGDVGKLVCGMEVLDGDTVMVVTAGGVVTRLKGGEIPEQGRRTQGTRLVKLASGDRVVEVTRGQGARDPAASRNGGGASRPEASPSESDAESPAPEGQSAVSEQADAGSDEQPPTPEKQLDLLGGGEG